MIHGKKNRILGSESKLRKALLRGLVRSLFLSERIETTVARAKETAPIAETLIGIARRGDLASRRLVLSKLPDDKVVARLFKEIAPRFIDRPGGFTRILRTRFRPGDGAEMCYLELVDRKPPEKPAAKDAKPKETAAR